MYGASSAISFEDSGPTPESDLKEQPAKPPATVKKP
jgi:hypothetical protein